MVRGVGKAQAQKKAAKKAAKKKKSKGGKEAKADRKKALKWVSKNTIIITRRHGRIFI